MEIPTRMRHVLVHYNEIALKGKNRGFFEERLISSIKHGLAGLGWKKVKRLYGRLLVEFRDEVPWEEARARLGRIHGISHFSRALRTDLDIGAMRSALEGVVGSAAPGSVRSFAVRTKRANKRFPMTSVEVNRELGGFVKDRTGWAVSIDAPDLPIYVSILAAEAYVAFERAPGAGGLPRGTAGKVLCLISGGIDSPVAANRLLHRGAVVDYVHFHSFPHTTQASIDKAREIVDALVRWRGSARLHMVPFAELQRRIVAGCPSPYRVLLYRRFMMRAAEAIARRDGALALVTGESLGQVASQTLENLSSIEAAVSIPVLRPLIGMDKLEICREAEAIGTFPISVRPHEDCCGFLMPKNPATHSRPEELEAAEKVFDIAAEVAALVAGAETTEVGRRTRRRTDRTDGTDVQRGGTEDVSEDTEDGRF